MSPAQKFLQKVEETGMVSEPLLAELRRRVADTHRNMRPEMLAKLLVDRGELTAAQARKLVALTIKPPTEPPPAPPEPEPELTLADEDQPSDPLDPDDYQLAPVDKPPSSADDPPEVAELDLADEETAPEAILIESGDDLLADVPGDDPTPSPPVPPPLPDPVDEAVEDSEADDLLEDDVLADPVVAVSGGEGRRLSRRKRGLQGFLGELFKTNRPRKNRWDSPLILLGGGALILLVAAGTGLFALFYSESAEEVFNAAQDAYTGQSYATSIENFERLADRFPNHEKASLARVRIQMAKIRQITDGSKDWERALEVAATSLPTVKQEPAFDDVRGELAKLLPDITAGLVDLAKTGSTTDEQDRLIELASAARELVDNSEYLPTSERRSQEQRIFDIDESIAVVRRDISRDRKLSSVLSDMQAAAESGDIKRAYQLRDDLLSEFPILSDNSALLDAARLIAAKERDGVTIGSSDRAPRPDDYPPVAEVTVVLSDRRGETIQQSDREVVCVLANGAVYGVRVANGDVLWRRYVGFDTDVVPQSMGNESGSDFLIVDGQHSELQRVKAETGDLVWRLPCPRPIHRPRLIGERMLVCCGHETESRLLSVAANGDVETKVTFPVGCTSAPALFADPASVVQLGSHSSVYVLDAETLQAQHVIPLGQDRASVATAPIALTNHLVVAINEGADRSRLHVYSASPDGDWSEAQTPIALPGQIISEPVVDERRMLVTTDVGETYVFEVASDRAGLREVAHVPGEGERIGTTYAILDRSNIWMANNTFGRYELQATRAAIVTKWVRNKDDQFLQPLYRRGQHLIHVRRRTGMEGVTVSAIEVSRRENDGRVVWETDLGVPSVISVNGQGGIHATTVNGAMFPVDRDAVQARVTSRRSARIDPRLLPNAIAQYVPLSRDVTLFAGPPPITHYFISNLLKGDLQRTPLRLGADVVSTELVPMGAQLLAACETGPIHLLDAASGQRAADPFLPRIEPGTRISWLLPASVGPDMFLAAERTGRLYLVRITGNRLELVREHVVEGDLTGGLASAGEVAFAVMTSSGGDSMIPIFPKDLSVGKPVPLRHKLVWGPKRVGNVVLASDHEGHAYAFNEAGELQWVTEQPVGPIAGQPLTRNGRLVFASTSGMISIVGEDGTIQQQTQVAEPLGSGPVAFNDRLLVAGWDGSLYVVQVSQ